MDRFRLALVTGATSGIGEALCYRLVKQGIPLLATGRNREKLKLLKENLQEKIETIESDLLDEEERKKLIAVVKERTPDLIINNAGFGYYGPALSLNSQQQIDTLTVNGTALLEISLEGGKALVAQKKKGVIMNISSVAGFFPMPNFAVYAATKAFVTSFSEAFDFEMREHGIRVLASCPGRVATDFQQRAAQGKKTGRGSSSDYMTLEFAIDEIWQQITKLTPVRAFDWRYRLLRLLIPLLPRTLYFKLLSRGWRKRSISK